MVMIMTTNSVCASSVAADVDDDDENQSTNNNAEPPLAGASLMNNTNSGAPALGACFVFVAWLMSMVLLPTARAPFSFSALNRNSHHAHAISTLAHSFQVLFCILSLEWHASFRWHVTCDE
jgi:hypothetical protein